MRQLTMPTGKRWKIWIGFPFAGTMTRVDRVTSFARIAPRLRSQHAPPTNAPTRPFRRHAGYPVDSCVHGRSLHAGHGRMAAVAGSVAWSCGMQCASMKSA
jgi:hypothetical protein